MFQKLLQSVPSSRGFLRVRHRPRFSRWGFAAARPRSSDITGSLGDKAETQPRSADPRRDVELTQERFRANPKDADAALHYGKALRATGQKSQAVAVLEQATIGPPSNKALLAGYGRALADNGNFQQALDVLGRAHTPRRSGLANPLGAGSGARSARPI